MQERLGSRIGAYQQGLTMPTGLGGCSLALPATKEGGCTTGALSPADSSRHAPADSSGGAQSEWPSAARAAAAAAKRAGCGSGLSRWSRNSCATRDTTIVSPLTANGVARSLRDPARPIALQEARRRKEATYPELVGNARCRLVVLGAEVGGRWSAEAAEFVRLLAHAKARAAPAVLRGAYVHRWSGLLAAAASLAFAESLTCLPSPGLSNLDGPGPDISDLLAGARDAPDVSRLPAR